MNGSDKTGRITKQLFVVLLLTLIPAACALKEEKPPPEPPSPEPPPEFQCPTLPARDLQRQALELLGNGEVASARELLDCVLESKPDSKQAMLLIEQLDADPVATLGKQYFWHRVKRNETLSIIAHNYLGSSLKFVILARYNEIAVPANLPAGIDIKIPGKKPARPKPPEPKPPEPKPPEPKPPEPKSLKSAELPLPQVSAEELRDQAVAMEQQGKLEKAYKLMTRAVTEDASLANAGVDLARIRESLLLKLEEDAYNQELNNEPKNAADIWRKVLEIAPDNIPAQLALKRLAK